MNSKIQLIKGIHPGLFLERELKLRNIKKGRLAISVNEFPQTLVSITKGKRNMNTPLALKIERILGFEEGLLMILQVYYEIEREKANVQENHPDFTKLRKILFWDTDFNKINWQKQKKAVIQRVHERGNQMEKEEILRFYGNETIKKYRND